MSFTDWIYNSAEELQNEGIAGVANIFYQFYLGLLRRFYRIQSGDNEKSIFDRDWDVLIILDACRCDLIESVETEYDFLNENQRFWSMGSMSREWMERNFSDEYLEQLNETAYVTGNVFSDEYTDSNDFYLLDEVWKYAWKDGTVPARAITDRAIHISRSQSPERMVVHYMQPHSPSVPDPLGEGMVKYPESGENWLSATDLLRQGEISQNRIFESYKSNLQYVLDDVQILLENLDADDVVITSDHGEAFGEWHVYGHPDHMPIRILREVPWYETSATDEGGYEPSVDKLEEQGDIEEKLKSLGYL